MPLPEENNKMSDLSIEFEDWLNEKAVTPPGVTVYDLDMMQVIIGIRLRSVFTYAELHQRAHGVLQFAEHILQSPDGMVDDNGNVVPPLLAENFQGSREDHAAMLNISNAQVTDEALEELLRAEQGEEE